MKTMDQLLSERFPVTEFGAFNILKGVAGSGRSSRLYDLIAQAQRAGHKAALFDVDGCFNSTHAESLGLIEDDVRMFTASNWGELLERIETLKSEVDLICVDGVDLVPFNPPGPSNLSEVEAFDFRHFSGEIGRVIDGTSCRVILTAQSRRKPQNVVGAV